jgi:hypothetical protein
MNKHANGEPLQPGDFTISPRVGLVAGAVHVNLNDRWWDTTTAPWPWVQPYQPPIHPQQFTITTGMAAWTYPTQEQKAEIVLAVLLNVLMGKNFVELSNKILVGDDMTTLEFVYNEHGLLIRVPPNMKFSEIVAALYEEFGNLRGKQLR